ncbi:MAG: hypothetical protein GX418_12770 [Clostridiales bacterium]|nr:hypothetical protein [Clostridiales bacterium]
MTNRRPPIRSLARLLGCLLAGVLCMFAFTVSPTGYTGVSDPPLRAGSPAWLLYAAALGGLFLLATGRKRARVSAGMAALGLLFGLINYFATTLFAYDTWAFLDSARAWLSALLCVLGQAAAMMAGIALVCGTLERARAGAYATLRPTGGTARQDAPDPADAAETTGVGSTADASRAANAAGPVGGKDEARPPAAAGATASLNAPHRKADAALARRLAGRFRRAVDRAVGRFPRLTALCRRRPVPAVMALLLLCWSPFLIVFYPGTVIWDMGEMLGQLYGLRQMSTWHPVFTTWLFGGCVWLGRQLSGDNLGAFLFTLLQTLFLAYALADSVRFLRRLGLPRGFRLAALAFFGLTPIFGAFAQAIGKDTLYTAALLVFAVRTAEAVRFGVPGPGWAARYALWALLACLVRTNGVYVVAGTAVLAASLGLRGAARWKTAGALGAALALAFVFSGVLVPALGIQDETASGLYSVCFQQSARTLRDHADTVTAEEYAEIDRVLDAARLPALYEAVISDPVKYTFRQYGQGRAAEAAALSRYRQTWLSMLRRYPLTYLEAFVAGNSGYYAFTPKIDASQTYNFQGGIRFVFETYDLGPDPRYLHTVRIAALESARVLLAAYARGWRRVPVLEWFLFCPTYTWLLVAAGLSVARRRWRELAAFAPALLSLGVCLLSPVNDYFRYFLPVVALTPALLGLAATAGGMAARRRNASRG